MNFLLLQILQGQSCYGQKCNEDSLFNKFRKDIQIEQEENHGRVVWDDETKESYYVLMANCPIAALVKYTDDPIPAIRSAIFAGIAQKNGNNDMLTEILRKHLNDTAKYEESPTDVVTTSTVSEFMQLALKLKADNKLTSVNFKSRLKEIRSQTSVKIKIEGIHHGLIEKDNLLRIDSLVFTVNKFKIISFALFVAEETIKSSSNILTNDMKIAIKKTEPGDVLFFDDIRIVSEDKIVRKFPSMSLKLK